MEHLVDSSSIPAGEFKAKCLQLLDAVASSGATLTITKRGRPVARLVPMPTTAPLFGAMRGSVTSQRDLVARNREHWDADV